MTNKPLYGVMIPRIELLELTSGITKEISTHSLGQWIKSRTGGAYVVIERAFVLSLMDGIKLTSGAKSSQAIMNKYNFEQMEVNL